MLKSLHVGIVGYGTAGQALSLLLSRDGHHVEVFERATKLGPVGAGFLLQPTGLQVLWELGVLPEAMRHGRRIHRLYGETGDGRTVMDMRYSGMGGALFGLGMQRGALFQILANAWPDRERVREATAITAIDSQAGTLVDAEGRRHGPYDLVIVADGASSQLRSTTQAVRRDALYPWGALWCLVPQGEWPWADELRQRYVAARKMIGFLPVGTREDDATPRLSFFWSLRGDAFNAWQRADMAEWKREVCTLWPQAGACLQQVEQHHQLARAVYRDATVHGWARDRVVLAGDAAHAMSPQLGQGVNMALMDALALRDALRAETSRDAALARYQRERQSHVRIYQFWSRWLTPLFQSDRDRIARVRDLAFLPLGRLPLGRTHMLRVLSGTQHGWFGHLRLKPDFLVALQGTA